MRVLVTNDDGVDATGLAVLARAVVAAGHDTLVVAPLGERSGASASIGDLMGGRPFDVTRPRIAGLEAAEVRGLDAPPALCTIVARMGAFGPPPEVVISGINPGLNTGRSILHSGTVGAVLTAANNGISGVAVSLAGADPQHWDTAATLGVHALDWLAGAPARTVVNLNVPDVSLPEVRGVRRADPAALGEWHAELVSADPDKLELALTLTDVELPPNTDTALVARGYAAVTLLQGPTPAAPAGAARYLDAVALDAVALDGG